MLSPKLIKALKPANGVKRVRDKIPDPALKGFGVLVTPAGSKSFFLQYTSPETGKRRYMSLGAFPAVSLAQARSKAREARATLQLGIDPVEQQQRAAREKEARDQHEAGLGSVSQLFEFYIKDLEMDGKRAAQQVRYLYEKEIKPAVGHLKAQEVTTDHCADLLTAIADRGALRQADLTRSYLRAAFEFGLVCRTMPRWRQSAPDFDLTRNPAAATRRAQNGVNARLRHLDKQELKTVWEKLGENWAVNLKGHTARASLDLTTQLAIKLIISTGQRVEEVLGATWAEFDLDAKQWVIPGERRKTRKLTWEPHLVPLTDFHIELLNEIRQTSPEGFLFPNKAGTGPRKSTTLSQALRRMCDRFDIERFQPRDLRRTWKTLAGSIGIDLELRNRIQGHALQDVGSRHYDRYAYLTEKRQAMEKWTDWLERLLAGSTAAVIDLNKRRA